ncbi:hypothetical protein SLEP1_g32925 [Rubroshorea leprosula]|uniref:Uncharacterized protein n=1 Tax=Rubroshorea leprosula TaxID=152421 RepID=A0AAV5KF05_9ROSI|nr:hypothetical protein SLEP1_g32925 [Rubroshorea leprosula]
MRIYRPASFVARVRGGTGQCRRSLSFAAKEASARRRLRVSWYLIVAFLKRKKTLKTHMRGIALFLPTKFRFKQIYPMARSWGTVFTTTPKKLVENNDSKEAGAISNGKTDPIVAFSRPPPIPPFLGPLVALSLLEMWSSRDSDDN